MRFIRLAALLGLAAAVGFVGYTLLDASRAPSVTVALARGQRPAAPGFSLPRFDGGTLALADLRGRAVVLNFWASWCPPCRAEAPLLERVWRTYRERGVVVVGVNVRDVERDARAFLKTYGATFPNVRDRDRVVETAYGVTGLPETFFIDRAGHVVRKFPGAALEWTTWADAVDGVLGTAAQGR